MRTDSIDILYLIQSQEAVTAWRPDFSIPVDGLPRYQRLIGAIAKDIASGVLAPGERLPPQRDLAHALSISVGAVTRAYDEVARRGLIEAHVGRGTFVVERYKEETANGFIDLSINVAPIHSVDAFVETFAGLRKGDWWAKRLAYQPPCGLETDRRAAAIWLKQTANFGDLDWRNLICCSGAQSAMAIAFSATCRSGEVILTESLSFSGAKALADHLQYRFQGVAMDAEGVLPEALDEAAARTGARVFYTLPTLQNPTARIAGRTRRANIAEIARARNMLIIEDDVYASYAQNMGLLPIASEAPERTLYVTSVSKILSPGLRAGFLVTPPGELHDRCLRAVRALMHSPAGVNAAIATALIESGRAAEMARATHKEVQARTEMTLATLAGKADRPASASSLHIWLPMPEDAAERMVARAMAAGLRLTSPRAYTIPGAGIASGVRLCIGSAASRQILARALAILKAELEGESDDVMHASL